MIQDLLQNPYFLIPVISFFIAQLIKLAIKVWRNDPNAPSGIKSFFSSGNMPSSHTAMVVALAITTAFESGLGSADLGIAFVLASIVVYDALNVRRAVGEQGGVLQALIDRARVPKEEREKFRLSEALGHRPIEVLAGAALAFTVTMILEHEKWWDWFNNGIRDITDFEIKVFYAISAAAIVLGLMTVSVFHRRHLRKLPTSNAIIRVVTRGLIVPGLLGLVATWLVQEQVARFDTAIWLFFLAVWSVVVISIGWGKTFNGAITRLALEKEHFSEEKKRLRAKRKSKKRR